MNETQPTEVIPNPSMIIEADNTAGATLQAKRLALSLSLADVADKLKLSVQQIEALECNRYNELPGRTFIRGFVRSYARLLDIDADALLAQVESVLPEKNASTSLPDLHQEKTTLYAGSHRQRIRIQRILSAIIFILSVLAIGALGVHYLMPTGIESELEAPTVISSVPLQLTDNVSETASIPLMASSPTQVYPIASQPAIQTGPGVLVASGNSAVPACNTLQIQAERDSWIQVIDGNNEILFEGVVNANTAQNLGGQVPYQVRVGNAKYTKLIYDGKGIDLTPFTQANVAILSIK